LPLDQANVRPIIKLDDQKSESFDQSLFDKPYASRFGSGERRGITEKSLVTPGPGS